MSRVAGKLGSGLWMVALSVGLLAAGPVAGGHHERAATPWIVKIHADWCGTCKALEPTWSQIERELGDRARVVLLDVTDDERKAQAAARAAELGIEAFFEAYRGKTGTIGVLAADGTPVEVLKGERDLAAYESALARAQAGA